MYHSPHSIFILQGDEICILPLGDESTIPLKVEFVLFALYLEGFSASFEWDLFLHE